MRNFLALLLVCSCAGDRAVSSTTASFKAQEHAPPPPDTSARVVTGNREVPKPTDPSERLVWARAGSIWIATAEGKDAMRVTYRAQNAPDETPAVSKNGEWIAFASARDGTSKIFVTKKDGSELRAVTDGSQGGDVQPAFDPTGARIAFMRGRERRSLWITPLDGGPARRALESSDDYPDHAGSPAWSPDGKSIVISGDRGEGLGTGLFLVDPASGAQRRLTRSPEVATWRRDVHPAWSPDGKRVAFASNRHAPAQDDADRLDLYAVDVASGDVTRLTSDAAIDDDPAFSPDGKRIFFVSDRLGGSAYETEVYVMPSEGGEQMRLFRDERPQNAAPASGRFPERP